MFAALQSEASNIASIKVHVGWSDWQIADLLHRSTAPSVPLIAECGGEGGYRILVTAGYLGGAGGTLPKNGSKHGSVPRGVANLKVG